MASLSLSAFEGATSASLDDGTPDYWWKWNSDNSSGLAGVKKMGSPDLTAVPFGSGTFNGYENDARLLTWSGTGDPTASGSNQHGIYNNTNFSGTALSGEGFTLTFDADTSTRQLIVYTGGYNTSLQIDASLSDASATPVSDVGTINDGPPGAGNSGYFVIEYAAASAGQTLTVDFYAAESHGSYANVTLSGATLKVTGEAPVEDVLCDLAVTDAADTASAAAGVTVGAALSETDAADTIASASAVQIAASLDATDAADALTSAASVLDQVACTLAVTDSADVLAAVMNTNPDDDEQYPLAGMTQAYPLSGIAQTYPLGAN